MDAYFPVTEKVGVRTSRPRQNKNGLGA